MTLSGWMQIALFLGAVAAVTVPLGSFMTSVFRRERTWFESSAAAAGAPDLPIHAGRRRTRDALDRVRVDHARVQRRVDARVVRINAGPGDASAQSTRAGGFGSQSRFQHCRVVHDKLQLAVVCRRSHNELPDPDGGAHVPELRVGRGRHCSGSRLHPWRRRRKSRDVGQFLGRHDQGHALGAAPVLCGRSPSTGFTGCCSKPEALRPCTPSGSFDDNRNDRADDRPRAGRLAGDDQAVGHQRRRLLQRQQRAPLREPHSILELHPDVRHLCDIRWAHYHAWPHDWFAAAWLGGVVCHGDALSRGRDRCLLGRSRRESFAHRN